MWVTKDEALKARMVPLHENEVSPACFAEVDMVRFFLKTFERLENAGFGA